MVPSQVVVSSGLKAPFKGPLDQLGGGSHSTQELEFQGLRNAMGFPGV